MTSDTASRPRPRPTPRGSKDASRTGDASREVEAYAHGRVPRDVRERHILALAEELFAERGYPGASMDELARRAGISKPLIYELVGNKDQVFNACINNLGAELASAVAGAVVGKGTWQDQLHAGGLAFFSFVAEHRRAWTALLSVGNQPLNAEVTAIRQRQHALVAQLMASAPADESDGSLTQVDIGPLELEALAHGVNGAFEALANWWAGHPEVDADRLATFFADLVTPGLRALARTRPLLTGPPARRGSRSARSSARRQR